MNQFQIMGIVLSIAPNSDGTTKVTVDSSAYGNAPSPGVHGPLENYFYAPTEMTMQQLAQFQSALTGGLVVTVNFTLVNNNRGIDNIIVTTPDFTVPLVRGPINQTPNLEHPPLGHLHYFIGTWNSPRGPQATGYNVMPLPQTTAPDGYITKNFPYYEEITFAPIAGSAPNRSGNFTQTSGVLFYEQRVFIANNPAPPNAPSAQDTLIHAENGSWLYHTIADQVNGPYGPGTVTPPVPLPTQLPAQAYNKQVSVPHGNSLLLVGQATVLNGRPHFPTTPRNLLPFTDPSVIDPITVLSQQLDALEKQGITVQNYIQLDLDSSTGGAGINNISFGKINAIVNSFKTSWFIEFLSNGQIQLQYLQSMVMTMDRLGQPTEFLHVDANTLQRVA